MASIFEELYFPMEYFVGVCRICLSKAQVLIPIDQVILTHQQNEIGTTEMVNLVSVFLKYCGIEVKDTDCKPKNICESCIDMSSKAFGFLQKIIWSDQLLDHNIKHVQNNELNIKLDHEFEHNMSIEDVDVPKFETEDVKFDIIEHDIEDGNDEAIRFEIVPKTIPNSVEEMDETIKSLLSKKTVEKESKKRKRLPRAPKTKCLVEVTDDGEEIFTCRFCETKVAGFNEFVDHYETEHPEKNRLCALCPYQVTNTRTRPFHIYHMAKKHTKKAIVCDFCSLYFRTQEDLDTHNSQIDHENKTCLLCHMDFRKAKKSTFGKILSHIDRVHKLQEKNFLCSHCGKAFKYPRNLRRHIEVRHEGKRFLCQTCGAEFGAVNTLNLHRMKTHGDFVPIKSRITRKFEVMESSSLKRHKLGQESKTSACPTGHCARKFRSSHKLYAHADIHNLDFSNYKCQICSEVYVSFADLKQHQVRTHDTHKCTDCGETFVVRADYVCHIRQLTPCVISKKASYRCRYCPKMYESLVRFYFHSRIHPEFKEYLCKICNLEYDSYALYSKHYEEHKIHVCSYPQCGKGFITKQKLNFHVYRHTEKIFSCNICNATVNTAPRLQIHIRTVHLNERLFECKTCGKSFKQSAHLRTHQTTHGTQKPWECTICGLRFLFESLLHSHLRTHTGQKPYKCLYCTRHFRDSTTRHKHIIKAHEEFTDDYLEYRKNQLRKDNAQIEAKSLAESKQDLEMESQESYSGDSDYEYTFVDAAEFDNVQETVVYDDEEAVGEEEDEYGDNEEYDVDCEQQVDN